MEPGGRHLSVRTDGDELYRLTRKHDGHWLWCDRYGNSGGDNIDLVKEIEDVKGFSDAVYRLISAPIQTAQVQPKAVRKPPTIPLAYGSKNAGREYLRERGISQSVIEHAESVGMLRYAPGSIFFVGMDEAGKVQSATRRATSLDDDVQRRDLKGTDKRYPAIFAGDPERIWIVEGGIDALALHTMYERRGEQVPTVIVSGGANVRGFLERNEIQQMLRLADRVTVACEREKDTETQARTDSAHASQCSRMAEITGRMPETWRPREAKDLADYNVQQIEQKQREEAEREQEEAQVKRSEALQDQKFKM